GDPVAQGGLVDPQVTSHLGDRLVRLLDDPDRALAELPVVLLADLWHRYPLSRIHRRSWWADSLVLGRPGWEVRGLWACGVRRSAGFSEVLGCRGGWWLSAA